MSEKTLDENPGEPTQEEIISALFAHMVIQNANMAMMLLGKVPHPQTGKTIQDFEAAKMFIDQLEMLAVKTKGNLSKEEESLLKQSLTALQMAFVEAVEAPARQTDSKQMTSPAASPAPASPSASPAAPAAAPSENPAPAASSAEEESKKKFSKKY